MTRSTGAGSKAQVIALTADAEFEQSVRSTFNASAQIDLRVVSSTIAHAIDKLAIENTTVIIVDLDPQNELEMAALQRLTARTNGWPPVVAILPAFDANLARVLLQMKVADFLIKPVPPVELVRTCARVATPASAESGEAEIYTFLPAVGGAGVTTLAIQTALLLLSPGSRGRSSTCLVDLNFQHGAVCDYLDLEPRLDLNEIEPRPERLDRQLLEVMLSYHASGLAVIAAPNRPAEMRSFDPDVVTRLLDLVSSNFDFVVIDMPRTWFSWTDAVLLGSNRVYVVSEMTVPSLKYSKQLLAAMRERLGDAPQAGVIVNRFEQRVFQPGLKMVDLKQALADDLASTVPNNYRLVREAIDRGVPLDEVKPGNAISLSLKKLIAPAAGKASAKQAQPAPKKLNFSLAR
jgi:pilus assembly protein CpaE